LITRGGTTTLQPLPLRIAAIRGIKADESGGSELFSSYISLEPQSANRLTYLSDIDAADSSFAPLEAAFDQGLLDCAVVLGREANRGQRRKLQSAWVSFGANLHKKLREEVIKAAGGGGSD
jgi:hypothetical protein